MVGENAPQVDGWTLPTRTFCARLIGDDHCDCPSCQIDAHQPPVFQVEPFHEVNTFDFD